MKSEAAKITTGAMFVAIFTIMILFNRYAGGFFTEFLLYIIPIPMVAYSAKFGLKAGVPVVIAMVLMAVIFGTPTVVFYALTECIIGLVFGTCIKEKVEPGKTLLLVMSLSTIANLLNTVVFAALFGINIKEDMNMILGIMNEALEQVKAMGQIPQEQLDVYARLFTMDTLIRLYIIAMILVGIIQGFLIYELSYLILNRLHFSIGKPRSVFSYYPPSWSGYLAFLIVIIYMATSGRNLGENYAVVIQTAGLCSYTYLFVFGFIAVMYFSKGTLGGGNLLGFFLGIVAYFLIPEGVVILGYLYLCTGVHQLLEKTYENNVELGRIRSK